MLLLVAVVVRPVIDSVRSTACLSCACSPIYIKDYFCQRLRFFSHCFCGLKKLTDRSTGFVEHPVNRLLKLAFIFGSSLYLKRLYN